MIAQLVTCPACGGIGQQEIEISSNFFNLKSRSKTRTRPCLACKVTGKVEADRVCPTCGKFLNMCSCPRGRIVQTTKSEDVEVSTGVTWNEKQSRWIAQIYKEGKQHYLGAFEDKALAEGIRSEAERMPVSEFPALRQTYRKAKKQGPVVQRLQVPEQEAAAPEQCALGTLLSLIQTALEADEHMKRLQTAAQAACDDAATAEQTAIEAWNTVMEALRDTAGTESAFNRSEFGSILLMELQHA